MIKLRVEGKDNDIRDYVSHIRNDENIEVNSVSDLYPNRKNVYSRCYLEIEFDFKKLENEDND